MKKILCLLVIFFVFLSNILVFANDGISVKIDGNNIEFDVEPKLINNRTMVPLRAIFESLGASVEWDDATQTVTSQKGDIAIKLTINQPEMYVNEKMVELDSPACLVNSRTLVPVRAISEAFSCTVDWNNETSTVYITTRPELCENGHEWKEATCNSSKKCVKCGMEEGQKLGHTVTEYNIEKEPSCSEYGIKSGTCTVCGAVVNENISMMEHFAGEWETVHTETYVGKKVRKCTICKNVIEEEEFIKNPIQIKDDYKFFSAPYNYLQLSRVADVNVGKKAHVKGCILQSIEGEEAFIFLVEITKTTYGWDDLIWVTYNRNDADLHRFVEKEVIDIYGEISGMKTYETTGGTYKTVPHIKAKYIDVGYVIVEK